MKNKETGGWGKFKSLNEKFFSNAIGTLAPWENVTSHNRVKTLLIKSKHGEGGNLMGPAYTKCLPEIGNLKWEKKIEKSPTQPSTPSLPIAKKLWVNSWLVVWSRKLERFAH